MPKDSSTYAIPSIRRRSPSGATAETEDRAVPELDGSGKSTIATGVGFFDHMLTLLARHSLIDLTVQATGDLHVDAHHTVEDVGICFGKALAQAPGQQGRHPPLRQRDAADGRDVGDGGGGPVRPAVLRLEGGRAAGNAGRRSARRWRRSSGGPFRPAGPSPCTSSSTTAATRTTSSRPSSRRRPAPCARRWNSTRVRRACPRRKASCEAPARRS